MAQRSATLARLTSRYPVTVTGTASVKPASRDGDTSPFWGGALIFRFTSPDAGVICSSGVAVYRGTTSGMTTDWHCGTGTWIGYASRATVGTVSGTRSQAKDTQVITGSSTVARVYIGPWNSLSSIPVYNAERPANNTGICTSGGVTGETCTKIYVRGSNMFVPVTGVGTVGPGFWILSELVISSAQFGNVRLGDSGSPAYSYTSASKASVKGFIVGVDESFRTLQCKGNPNAPLYSATPDPSQ